MPGYQKYTELDVWKQTRELVSHVYELAASYPKSEQFGIISQIRRSVVPVPSNIVKGCGRQHTNETMHFLSITRDTLFEFETRINISKDLSSITNDLIKIEGLGKLINGFIRYFSTKTKKPAISYNRQLSI